MIPLGRRRRQVAATATKPSTNDFPVINEEARPAPPTASRREWWFAPLLVASLAAHATLATVFNQPPAPLPSSGEQVMTVELVPALAAPAANDSSATVGLAPAERPRSDAGANYPDLVAAHLARFQRLPAEARAQRADAVATVRFTLDGSGRVSSVTLVRPSGVAALDRESQDAVRRASPFPAPPNGRAMSFTLPIRLN